MEINPDLIISGTNTKLLDVINQPDIYSTNEVKTNKIWIDGKPIYRLVLTTTTNGIKNDVTLRTPETIDTMVDYRVYALSTNGGNFDSLPANSISYTTGNTPRGVTYITKNGDWNANGLYCVSIKDYSYFIAIIEYTKN